MKIVNELPEMKLVDSKDIVYTINYWTRLKTERPIEYSTTTNNHIEKIEEAINRYKQPKVIT